MENEGKAADCTQGLKKIVNIFDKLEGYNCIGCSSANPIGLHMKFYEDGDDIVSVWKPSKNYEGWINIVHGGIQALILDEICAWVVIRKMQTVGVTSKMETRYRRPVHADNPLLAVRARIAKKVRNIIVVEAALSDAEGNVCTEATCTYFAFPRDKAEREMGFSECRLEGE